MREGEKKVKLDFISFEIDSPQITLREVGELYFQAKEIILSITNLDDGTKSSIIRIFRNGGKKVNNFFVDWQMVREIQPTDEELDLLEKALNEVSWAFDFSVANFPERLAPEDSRDWRERIEKSKKIIVEEKDRRKQIKDLQDQINSLRNRSNNSDNEAIIKDLQRQIEELKKILYFKPKSTPQQESNHDKGLSLPVKLLIGGGVVVVLVFLVTVVWYLARKKQ